MSTVMKNSIIVLSIITMVIVLAAILITVYRQRTAQLPPANTALAIVQVVPTQLPSNVSNQPQQIFVTFNQKVDLATLVISLTQVPLSETTGQTQVPISIASNNNGAGAVITTQSGLVPNSTYTLLIVNKKTQTVLYQYPYISGHPQVTPNPINTQQLAQFLPYETATYKLSYDATANLYVFQLKFDPNSSDDVNTQYEAAKAQATSFIKSKGVNPSSIVVDWRYH